MDFKKKQRIKPQYQFRAYKIVSSIRSYSQTSYKDKTLPNITIAHLKWLKTMASYIKSYY